MKKALSIIAVLAMATGFAVANGFDQQPDNATDAHGYYYGITGGKFVNGQTVNGLRKTGAVMKRIWDDPDWGGSPKLNTWQTDGWFAETAGLALTMKNGQSTVYDNFNNDTDDFYTVPSGSPTEGTPGMYRTFCMSNNFDHIYAGYFLIAEETTVDTIKGYFDAYAGFDPEDPAIEYRMNFWSAVWDMQADAERFPVGEVRPGVASFTGDVFSSDNVSGSFSWGDTGVDRIYGDDYGNVTDDILYLESLLSG